MQALQLLCLDETRCGDVALLMACAVGAPLSRLHMARCAGVTDTGLQVPARRSGVAELYISPYLPTSPHISPHLPISPRCSAGGAA